MAEVVNSLFGITPESLMAERENALQAQAMQYARMDPFQRATAGIYAGANRLGGAVGGLLGAQDPEMMRVQQRQQLLQGVDISDPKVLRERAAAAMQQNDYAAAQQLVTRAMDIEAKQASTAKDLAAANREKQASIPSKIAESDAIASYKQAIRTLEAGEQTPEVVASIRVYKDKLAALEPADKVPSFGAEAERYSRQFYKKPYSELSQTEMAKVNAKVEETAKERAPKVINQLPGVEKAGDVTGLRKDLQAITKPYQDQSDAAQDAIELADMALKSNNFAAVSSLSRSLAKAAGETQLSRADVEAFGIDPSLVGRVSDTISTLTQGRPTADTLTKLRQLSEALKKKADSRISVEEQQLQDTARVSGLFTEPQINTVFRRRPSSAPAKTAFTSVKEAEAANLPKGTIITINGRRAVVE